MKTELLSRFPHLDWSLIAMLLFLAVFLCWCGWAFARKRKDQFEEASRLPLED